MKGPAFYGQDFLTIKTDEDLIKENIIRVLLTSPGERPMSAFGCRLREFLFEQSTVLKQDVEAEIKKSISRWEKRVNVLSVSAIVEADSSARINISCEIKETLESLDIDTIIRF